MGEVFDRYTDTAGNYHFTDTETGHHVIPRLDNNSTKVDNENVDLISRSKAIRWVKAECNPYGQPTLDYESGIKVIEHLERMPSAQPEQRWIPCSERLPEHRLYVLVTYKYEYGLIDNGITWYSETENKWNTSREVIAWMPLPEPFKE